MSKAKFAAARELIQERDYEAARAVLESLPGNETAEKWLSRLPVSKSSGATSSTASQSAQGWGKAGIGVLIGIALGFAIGGGYSGGQSARQSQNTLPRATQANVQAAPPRATATPMKPIVFTGNADELIGPVDFPPGLYRATVTTPGYVTVDVTPTQGKCGEGSNGLYFSAIFILAAGDANDGAEMLFTSEGCSALIEVSNVQEGWSLEFEKIS